jgi:hypothetical protein
MNFEPEEILIKWHKEIKILCEIGNHSEVDLPCKRCSHRLNIELDLQGLIGLS